MIVKTDSNDLFNAQIIYSDIEKSDIHSGFIEFSLALASLINQYLKIFIQEATVDVMLENKNSLLSFINVLSDRIISPGALYNAYEKWLSGTGILFEEDYVKGCNNKTLHITCKRERKEFIALLIDDQGRKVACLAKLPFTLPETMEEKKIRLFYIGIYTKMLLQTLCGYIPESYRTGLFYCEYIRLMKDI